MKEPRLKNFTMLKGPAGQGLVEYAFILLMVAVVVIAALRAFGITVKEDYYDPIDSAVTGAGKQP